MPSGSEMASAASRPPTRAPRRREAPGDEAGHRLAEVQRGAEIAAHQPGEERPYCSSSGRSSPRSGAQRLTSAALRTLAEHHLDRVAGDEVDQREDERRGEQRGRRHRLGEPAEKVADHTPPRAKPAAAPHPTPSPRSLSTPIPPSPPPRAKPAAAPLPTPSPRSLSTPIPPSPCPSRGRGRPTPAGGARCRPPPDPLP